MDSNAPEKAASWFDTVKEYTRFDELSDRINLSSQQFIEIVTYLGISFFVGFLFKKYFRHFFVAIAAIIVALVVFEALEVITIDWVQLRQMTGVSPQETLGGLVSMWIEIAKLNLAIVVSIVIGFFIGYKVG